MQFRIFYVSLAAVIAAAGSTGARSSGEAGTRAHHTRLAVGSSHTCQILDDGSVRCWGLNNFGQLGDGTTVNKSAPVVVTGLGPAVSIAAGNVHTCVVESNGTVSCWGDNAAGQLGNDAASFSTTPVIVSGLTNVVALAGGKFHTCALRVDGSVWCWGDNQFGQLGNGIVGGGQSSPARVQFQGAALNSPSNIAAITAGGSFSCALGSDGLVFCWGDNSAGELGNGGPPSGSPLAVSTAPLTTAAGVRAIDLAAGDAFICALLSDASVSCWGQNSLGELGNGSTTSSTVPVVSKLAHSAVALGAGSTHACAIRSDGFVYCWGGDARGQLGDGASTARSAPVAVGSVIAAVEVGGGFVHTCAILAGGSTQCWGDNSFGQHGNGTTTPSGTDSVRGISGTFLAHGVSAGTLFTCARRGNGTAACWGAGSHGQLGNSGSASSASPVAVTGLTNIIAITAGKGTHACALDATNLLQCWGENSRGQLGDLTLTDRNYPVVVFTGQQFTAISAGGAHTCGVAVGGTVWCWGAGASGQLGNGALGDAHLPVQVSGIQNAIAISSGDNFSCALTNVGNVLCWGDNSLHQLGTFSGASSSTPVPPALGLGFVGITSGANHTCGTSVSGQAVCWGSNSRGQIGDNATGSPVSTPTAAQNLATANAVSGGGFFSCSARSDGGASCWGANDSGELGAADSLDHLTPVPVVTSVFQVPGRGLVGIALTNIAAVSTGTSTVIPTKEQGCALLADGTLRCWGDNSQGEIGNGTLVNQPRPTAVNSFLANVDPAAELRTSRKPEVTALIDCAAGAEAQIALTLQQGPVTGTGRVEAECTGRLLRVPMIIEAHGPLEFQAGTATAQVEAIVRDERDHLTDDTHWTRQVTLAPAN